MTHAPAFIKSLLNVDITLSSTSNVSLTGNLTGSIVTNGASDGGSSTDYGVSSTEDRTLGTTKVGKLITAFEGVDAFKSKSQSVASNLNVTGNGNIINGLTNLTTEMKKSSFLQTGLSVIPYIGDAISLWDAIVGGGKSASGPQQVEILPLSVNLGVNISGSINTQNSYSGSVYRTPGSDVTTAPDYAYAYYNEVLGVINLLKKPQVQLLQRDVPMSPGTYRKETYIKLSEPLQFVLNPASLVDIVEIKGSYVSSFIGSMSGSIGNVTVSPENSGNYRTEYWDATSLPNTELISRTTGSQGGDYPSAPLKLKLMINLKRKNATANTQNILIVLTYPVSYTYTYSTSTTELNNFRNTTSATSYTVDNAIVTSFCQSTAYKTASRGLRYANQYNENIELMREAEKKYARTNMTNLIGINKFEVSPNPAKTNTNISFQLKKKGHVNITVTDGLGRNIKTLLTTTGQEGIKYSLNFNVSNFNSGVYIIKIQSGDYLEIRKILIIK